MEITVTPKRWGSSIAVIIPKDVVERQNIKENEPIKLSVEKQRPVKVKDIFGLLKEWKRSTQEIKDEIRAGWESDSDRERNKRWK